MAKARGLFPFAHGLSILPALSPEAGSRRFRGEQYEYSLNAVSRMAKAGAAGMEDKKNKDYLYLGIKTE